MRDTANFGDLASRLAESYAKDQQAAYRWPASLWVAGHRHAAASAAAAVRGTLAERSDPAADELEKFLAWFEAGVTSVD